MIERLHLWHLPFVRLEARRGRKVLYRSLDAPAERSAVVAGLIRLGAMALLELRTPVIAYMNPATELAIRFIDERYEQLFGESPAITSTAAVFADPDVHQAYRKSLADLLTTYFHLMLLAQACEETLGTPILLVPEALRDADAFRLGGRIVGRWAADGHRPPPAKLPPWLEVAVRTHSAMRGLRARIAIMRLIAHRSAVIGTTRAQRDAAFAVVSTAREVPKSSRSAEFLVDDVTLRRERVVFVPLVPLGPGERRILTDRGLEVADAAVRPDRAGYLRVLSKSAISAGWIVRATAELLRAHSRWSHFVASYEVGVFVSKADTGVTPIARNLVLRRAGVRTLGYSDSGNSGFHAGQTQSSRSPAMSHFAYLLYDDFATWNDRLLRFLGAHRQKVTRYHVIGCLWSDHIAAFRRGKRSSPVLSELHDRGRRPDQRIVAFFDSWYHPHGVNQAGDLAAFLTDILRLLDDRPDVFVVMKKKVPIVFQERDAARIYALHDRIRDHPRAHLFPPDSDTSAIAAVSDAVISFPFTSVTHEALAAGIPGALYDAPGKLRGWYYDQFPGLFLHGYLELLAGVDGMLAAEPLAFVARAAAAQVRPTELYLELGATDRLRGLVLAPSGQA